MGKASDEAKELAKFIRLDLKNKVKENILPDIKYQVKVIVKTNHTKVRIYYDIKNIDPSNRIKFYEKLALLYENKYGSAWVNEIIIDVRSN